MQSAGAYHETPRPTTAFNSESVSIPTNPGGATRALGHEPCLTPAHFLRQAICVIDAKNISSCHGLFARLADAYNRPSQCQTTSI